MENNLKFKVGDEVVVTKTGEKGTIKRVQSILSGENSVYVVEIGNYERLYGEAYLQLGREKNVINMIEILDMDELPTVIEIEERMKGIIASLNLVSSKSPDLQLANACKLSKFLVTKQAISDKLENVSKTLKINELYNGLVNGYNSSITNAYMFSEILRKVDMDVKLVALKDENGRFYVADLVLIGDKYYYFDVTLEKEIYADDQSDFMLCCAGIGKIEYEQYFKPMSILSIDNEDNGVALPTNISENDIDFYLINRIVEW